MFATRSSRCVRGEGARGEVARVEVGPVDRGTACKLTVSWTGVSAGVASRSRVGCVLRVGGEDWAGVVSVEREGTHALANTLVHTLALAPAFAPIWEGALGGGGEGEGGGGSGA